MELTKYTHACVSLRGSAGTILIDPGEWTESAAFAGVDAVLVTHEHFDHFDIHRLKDAWQMRPALSIYGAVAVVEALATVGVDATALRPGDSLAIAGFRIDAVGGEHAEIWCGKPGCGNLGFVVDESLYHPGDALFTPEADVETLLLPVSGPWLKTGEAIDFLHAVAPRRVIPIHDALLSDAGHLVNDNWIGKNAAGAEYTRMAAGDSAEVMANTMLEGKST
jgi:L-ascorbate metabolism protein UlaG (beta-lactamase superfamily)